MTNKFAGQCTTCGNRVEAGTGTCTKVAGRWAVKHNDCTSAPAAPAAPMSAGWSKAGRRYQARPVSEDSWSIGTGREDDEIF